MVQEQWVGDSARYSSGAKGDTWAREAAEHGAQGTQRIASAGPALPSRRVADMLELQASEEVVGRRRVMELDGEPVELTDSYFRSTLVAGTAIARPQKIRGGPAAVLAALGVVLAPEAVEEVEARPPTEAEQAALHLPDGVWVLVQHRLHRSSAGAPIQVDVMVASALRQRLRYEIKNG